MASGKSIFLPIRRSRVQGGLPIDHPRWREAVFEHGTDADRENGPAARSFAADAHDCIMVRIRTDLPYTSVRRENAPQWQAPLESLLRQAPSDTGASKKGPS